MIVFKGHNLCYYNCLRIFAHDLSMPEQFGSGQVVIVNHGSCGKLFDVQELI